ncbi:MAG: hypothetical protein AAFO04_20285 [Cyanobacteria bacterium J06592_8]
MSTLTDNITKKAHQGNIVAIAQVLNSKLAHTAVQIRAVLVDGVLQLLCEATQPEQLDQFTLVPTIQSILESLSPRHIYRVRINSRITQPQQLLWIEDINRSPNTQLLWYENIFLKKPTFPQQISGIIQDSKLSAQKWNIPKTTTANLPQKEQQFYRGLVGGLIVSLAALIVSFGVYQWLNLPVSNSEETASTPVETPTPVPERPPSDTEKFAQAVRLAEEAAADGKMAQTAEEWSAIAEKWEKAAALMESVSSEFERYEIAQDRVSNYRLNSEAALQKAGQIE